jgi:hypothetical protein
MTSALRITARPMLALRASESVIRKYFEDEGAVWVHVDINIEHGGLPYVEETWLDGMISSPKTKSLAKMAVMIKGAYHEDRWILCGAHTYAGFKDPREPSLKYFFTYEGVSGLERFKVNELEYPNGSIVGLVPLDPFDL